jgi:hypothetical protein
MISTHFFVIEPIRPAFLDRIRSTGLDDQDQPVIRSVARGGEPLRDLLRRARPGEEIILASYCPFPRPGPFREFGPIYVSAAGEPSVVAGLDDADALFSPGADATLDYFQERVTLRAYNHEGAIADAVLVDREDATNHLVEFLASPQTAFVDARFPIYGCFAARLRRA